MKSPKIYPLFIFILLFFTGISSANLDTSSQKKADQAQEQLEELVDQVLSIIQDSKLAQDPVKYKQVLYEKAMKIFDFKTFSRLALGRKYKAFSPDQQKDFILYFSKLISNTYFPKLAGQDVHNIQIFYLDTHALPTKRKIYRTDIHTQLVHGQTRIPVVYRMIQKPDLDWKIYDIKIEGVSMAANYNEQYRQQISLTPEQIIFQLKEKVEQ
ncbi:MAG: ABC transporter substrate-binding protein [Desulfobacter sp.]|nr:ABC transporter substrate-binding protein [Desulfobacter sp.]WDP86022.1 MAG: ABC transporter substrate-binding protein [Desulfobacter sp.]